MERLIVKNFGPIKEIDIEIKDVNVLIGTTASGKSTVAKLWAVFNSEELILKGCDTKAFKNVCKEYGLEGMFGASTEINYEDAARWFKFQADSFTHNIPGETIELYQEAIRNPILEGRPKTPVNLSYFLPDIFAKKFENPHTDPEFNAENKEFRQIFQTFDPDSQVFQLMDSQREKENFIRYVNILSRYIANPKSIYFPAERTFFPMLSGAIFGLLNKGVNIVDIIKDFGAKLEIAREEDKRVRIEFLNVDYVYSGGENWVILPDGTLARLSHTASGFQSVIPAYVILDQLSEVAEAGRNAIIIEEPEMNLYPNTQKDFLEYLVRVTNKTKSKLFITTHSPYILTALDNLVQAHNAFKAHPEKEEEIANIKAKDLWVDFDNVTGYFFDEGTCQSTLNHENHSLGAYAIDDVSEAIGEEFEALLKIEYAK